MKFYGNVGFANQVEYKPGRFRDEIKMKLYYGDVLRNSYRNQGSSNLVDDYAVSNQISILADQFALQNVSRILFVEWLNTKWKVSTVDIEFPRMTLTLGNVYNEEESDSENG